MRTRGVAAVVAAVLLLGGCGPGPWSASGSWAAEAEAWVSAADAAFDRHDLSHALFYAPDAVEDSSMLGPAYHAEGRYDVVVLQSEVFDAEVVRGSLYLDPTAASRVEVWVWSPEQAYGSLAVTQIGSDGVDHLRRLAATWYEPPWVSTAMVEASGVAIDLAGEYAEAWSRGDEQAIRRLYAPEATLTDGLHRVAVTGADAVAALAETGPAPLTVGVAADMLPAELLLSEDPTTPPDALAVFQYLEPTFDGDLSQVWMMLTSTGRCPGSRLVALTLDDDGRIAAERRFHEVESQRRCGGPDDEVEGWWTGRGLPVGFGERVTGHIVTPAGDIEIRNGTPATDALLRWSFDRFEQARLPAPDVSSIAFDPLDERCSRLRGHADWTTGTTVILVCFDSASLSGSSGAAVPALSDASVVGSPGRAQPLLHEVSHAWLVGHVDDATMQAFMRHVGVEAWNDSADDWSHRGVEWAAETLVWGLLGRANTRPSLGSPPCHELAEGFRLLTGAEPLTPCPDGGLGSP